MKKYSDRKLKNSMPEQDAIEIPNNQEQFPYSNIPQYSPRIKRSMRTEYVHNFDYPNNYRAKSKLDNQYGSNSKQFGLFTGEYGNLGPDILWNFSGENSIPVRAESWDRALNWAQDLNEIAHNDKNNKNMVFAINEDIKTPEGRTYTYRIKPYSMSKPISGVIRNSGMTKRSNMKKSINEKTKLIRIPKSNRSIRHTDKYFR